jgi:hypothetical protein
MVRTFVAAALLAACAKTGITQDVGGSADAPGDSDSQLSCELSDITDIHGTGSGNVWVVGDGGCVLHFDGADWNTEEAPSLQLEAVHVVSDEVVFAVGGDVVWKRSASGWEEDLSIPGAAFADVWADSESFAVAVGRDTVSNTGIIALRDGDEWDQMTPLTSLSVLSVWGESPDSIWVGGENKLLLHYNGAGWLAEQTGYEGDYGIKNIIGRGDGELWFIAANTPDDGMIVRRTVNGERTPEFHHCTYWGDWSSGFYEAVWTAPEDSILAGFSIGMGDPPQFGGLDVYVCDQDTDGCDLVGGWDGPEEGPDRLRVIWGISSSEFYIAGPKDNGPGLWKHTVPDDGPGDWEKVWD